MSELDSLSAVIERQIRDAVDANMRSYVETVINQLALDPNWLSRVENQVHQAFAQRLSQHIAAVDVDKVIAENLDTAVERWSDRLLENFRTRGITDIAGSNELTVMDGSVVVENELISRDVDIQRTTKIRDLVVTGSINTDNQSWQNLASAIAEKTKQDLTESWSDDLVKRVLDLAKDQGITFDQVRIGDELLISDGYLSSAIKHAKLLSLGTLESLNVSGDTDIANTVHVRNHRLGINTDAPDMALTLWDEEISIVAGKLSADRAYIGTGRSQNLSIGVNRQAKIEIDTDGMVTVPSLRIGRHQIGHASEVPGYSGTRGDILFNSDPRPDTPFAWVCLGAFRWQALRSA